MTRAITLPDGTPIELSAKQAKWMGAKPPFDPSCPGCVLFGCCVPHSSEWKDHRGPQEIEQEEANQA